MADANPLSFIFGGNTGMSYQELLRRRAVATAQASRQRGFPKTFGEGLTYLGESVGNRLESNRLSEAERLQSAKEDAIRGGSPLGGGYVPGAAAGPATAAPAPVLDAGSPDPTAGRARIAMALNGTPPEVASPDPTVGAETPLGSPSAEEARWRARTSAPDDNVEAWKHAIGGIESSQDYQAVGVPTKYGRAMGRYGVIEANVPKWTAEALGRPLTPAQFLADPKAQDAVFQHKFGQFVAKYGEEKAARAWYGGEGNINNLDATDAHEKLSVRDYGQDFLKRLRGKRAAAEDPTTMSDASPVGGAGDQLALSTRMPPNERPPLPTTLSPRVPQPQQPEPPPEPPPRRLNFDPDQPNPDQPTVTADIRPMSVRTQIAQAPAGLIPGATAGVPGVAMGPNQPPLPAPPGAPAGAPAAAPSMPPSREPIPPPSVEVMPELGPEPKRPGPLPPSKQQQYWQRFIDSPNVSDETRAHALRMYNAEEIYRKEISAGQQNDYVDKREAWQAAKLAREKFDREAPTRVIEQHIKRLQIEAAIAVQEDRPLDVQKKKLEIRQAEAALEDAQYKAGIPRTQAARQADLNIAESERKVAAPEVREIGGVIYERTPATAASPPGPWTPSPGGPKKEEKLTEVQGKTVKFLQRATVASSQLGDASVLAGLKDSATGKVPIGGNYLVSPEYQRARSAAFTWGQAVLRDESGAVLGAGEIANKLAAYFPEPGDSEQVIRDKAFRRKAEEDSLYHSLGEAKPAIDKWREERKTRKVTNDETGKPYEEGRIRINPKTGAKQRVMGGHWENEEDLR